MLTVGDKIENGTFYVQNIKKIIKLKIYICIYYPRVRFLLSIIKIKNSNYINLNKFRILDKIFRYVLH